MSYAPKLDLSKYDLLSAKDKLFSYVCEKAKSWGLDPNPSLLKQTKNGG